MRRSGPARSEGAQASPAIGRAGLCAIAQGFVAI